MVNLPPEKLGSFYLGAKYDPKEKSITSESINYDARDLTTHAICVGMTGSGKTGLCIGLLEEAAMDKVPALIIDPKGDMTNLLLQFENMEAADFEKWINADDAGRKGMTIDEYAAKTSKQWKEGIASWGQGPERIKALQDSVEYTIYTPGSDSGIPVNIMGSFAAPGIDFDSEAEMLRERIQGTVAALLGMVGNDGDPVRSREGILLSNLFEHYWRKQEDLDLTKIIKGIQAPPFSQLGVFDVDTFFPEKDRFELAMAFNGLIASPQFAYWLQGEALDIQKLYFTADGKPRHSIFYIAHLSESERMFFVTLLLNSLITWMRSQSGTTSLRSLLYFDEIFGYFPPTANPPSKKPLLTILKQARAFGVGAVLVTQNPVDIDYKGISNAGTWFIGKLQTERDKMRVLDGLEGAIAEAGGKGGMNFDHMISALSSRVFLLHNVHESEPVLFHTRWVMSYLRGPMTRPQVKELMEDRKGSLNFSSAGKIKTKQRSLSENVSNTPPSLDPSIEQRFLKVKKLVSEAKRDMLEAEGLHLCYDPKILAFGKVRFYDEKRDVDQIQEISLLCDPPDEFGRADWEEADSLQHWDSLVSSRPNAPEAMEMRFQSVPDNMNNGREFNSIKKDFSEYLYRNQRLYISSHEGLGIYQKEGESEELFHANVMLTAREKRDAEIDAIQDRFEDKLDKIEDRIRREEQDLAEAEAEMRNRRTAEVIGVAETLYSVFVRRRSRSISSATSKSRMRKKAAYKVRESQEELEDLQEDFIELEDEMNEKIDEVRAKWEHVTEGIIKKEISPRRADVIVEGVALAWCPYWENEKGERVVAF